MLLLVRRISITVLLALFLVGVLMAGLVRTWHERFERNQLRGPQPALRFIARDIADHPPERRAQRIAEIQPILEQTLQLRPEPAMPTTHPRRSHALEHWIRHVDRGPPWIVFRLDAEWVLCIGPPSAAFGPPKHVVGGPIAEFVIFVLVASLIVGVLVSVPFARRLRAIEASINRLALGDFRANVDTDEGDALGAISRALERSKAKLDRMFSERTELLQAVSHELGTPLSRMRFILPLLLKAQTDDERALRAQAIDSEIAEIDNLSTELIRFVEANDNSFIVEPLDVAALIDSVVESERVAQRQSIEVALQLSAHSTVIASASGFERALSNVLRNALRYAKSKIVIEAHRAEQCLIITIHDDGPGIPEDQRARVIEPFVRVDPGRSREHGGVGLGLAIVHRILQRHQGSLTITDSPLGGTAVVTRWPFKPLSELSHHTPQHSSDLSI